jgi:hypothetical protein
MDVKGAAKLWARVLHTKTRKKKKVDINKRPETFNFGVIAE